MSYSIERKKNCVYIIYEGEVILDDILEVNGIVTGSSTYDTLKYIIVDYLKVTNLNLSEKDIKIISNFDKNPYIWNSNLRLSIICNKTEIKDKVFSYIEKIKAFTPWEVKTFANLEESKEWCNQQ